MVLNSHEEYELITFIRDYLAQYPLSEIRDIYKLLYQSFHGAEHNISDREITEERLLTEWYDLETGERDSNSRISEPINIKNLTPILFRVHLAPARAQALDPRVILYEFLRAADEFPVVCQSANRDLDLLFRDAWHDFGNAIGTGEIKFKNQEFLDLTYIVESSGWSVMHHSDAYREAYNPHYRLSLVRL